MGISIDEKRVYDASEGPTPVYVVGEFGVARVDTSDDLVGEFGLVRQCSARDAAGRDGQVAVATDEDVLVGVAGEDKTKFEELHVGPAVAVGFTGDSNGDDHLLVAREEGTIVRGDGENWTELGELDDVRAIDGDLLATESGVYRATSDGLGEDGLQHVGLESVRDVSTAGVPLAAADDGLYKLGNGWMEQLDGDFRCVSAVPAEAGQSVGDGTPADAGQSVGGGTPADAGTIGWAHAAGEDGLLAHEEGEWTEVELPVGGDVVALDHGTEGAAYAATAEGTVLLSVGDGWNHQILGLRGVRAVAVP